MTPRRIVQGKGRDIELALGHRVPLLLRLEQRGAGIDSHLEVDAGLLHLVLDDLDHLAAHILLRPLVRGAQTFGRSR